MSKKSRRKKNQRKRQPPPRRFPWHWLAVGAAAVLLVIAGVLAVKPWSNDEPQVMPEVVGAPRLEVDQTEIDEGYIKYDDPIRTTFHLSNVGNQPLEILGEPQVRLVEGC